METEHRIITASSADGLKIVARDWGPENSPQRPIVCLPGLTRNARDFNDLASHFSNPDGPNRRVIGVDYRGRGLSDHDPDWQNYSLPVEQLDILAVLDHAKITKADVIGTSRGGLHIMLLATAKPDILGKAVINDIGPVIELSGLQRLAATIGLKSAQVDWASAAAALRAEQHALYPDLNDAGWLQFARQIYREEAGAVIPDYDLKIRKTLENIGLTEPPAALWELYAGLQALPTLALRGALSDLLSEETLREMHAHHRQLESLTIENQGHAPLLWDTPTLQAVEHFLA